jgi:DNA-3-methyladenine glycosylase
MFVRPGTLYVYRIHQVVCANVVTRPGQAVLLRAAEPGAGLDGSSRGPGRLCRSFGITLTDDGADLVTGRIRVLTGNRPPERIVAAPRVGISQATRRRLRYALAGNRWVSLPRPWAGRVTA